MTDHPSRVFTIPPGAAFLPTLSEAFLAQKLVSGYDLKADPLLLADSVIFLPTRRSVRTMQDILTRQLGGSALLPRITALGDVDEEMDESLLEAVTDRHVISSLERRLVLARLVRRWAEETSRSNTTALLAATAPEALHFATHLATLIDSFETENVPWEKLISLVPENHAQAWDTILDFLKIAARWWPEYLAASNSIGAFEKRRAELAAIARHLGSHPPRGIVVAAGSTGSAPATASLLATIATLPNGAVVLPGLDTHLDAASWARLDTDGDDFRVFSHPQRGLNRLLQKLATPREKVISLGTLLPELENRQQLVSNAMRPAETTDLWVAGAHQDFQSGMAGITVLETRNERFESLCIALLLREILETPDKTAALITPDRTLAKSVAAELSRWGVDVDDSAGTPLFETPAGIFALLAAEAAAANLSPETLPPLFHHTLFHVPEMDSAFSAAQALELGVLRGPEPAPGAAGLHLALAENRSDAAHNRHAHPTRKALGNADWMAAGNLISILEEILTPTTALLNSIPDYARWLRLALERLSGTDLFASADGEALAALLEAMQQDESGFALSIREFPSVLRNLMQDHTVRPMRPAHPRLAILGLLEARLLNFDRVVLGGLVEGNWPPDAHVDPWLSRPMRASLGLPPPEWRLGLTAHDFEEALGGQDVILSRPLKKGGTPTVPARWLLRLEAVAGKEIWQQARDRGQNVQTWATALDKPASPTPLKPPEPCPPLALRPTRLSVTQIETLIRDPYHIYAHTILKLQPLDDVGILPSFSERGSLVHEALAQFTQSGIFPTAPHAAETLLGLGQALLEPLYAYPSLHGIWSIQFERIAYAFLEWEAARRPYITHSNVEIGGSLNWTTSAQRTFTLTARADRIDRLDDGSYGIVDYKTGSPPSAKQVLSGFSPQLTLEAALVQDGGFKDLPAAPVSNILYVHLSGGLPPLQERAIQPESPDDADPLQTAISDALQGAITLINRFEDPASVYASNVRPQFLKNHAAQPYRHLARVDEWSLLTDDEGEA